MKVVFVALGQEQLGISILSAVLRRAGHDTALVFDPALFADRYYLELPALGRLFQREARVVDEVVAEAPDLVAFSVLTPTYTWALDVAARVRARLEVPVIFGGVHPSAVPDVCLENPQVDYVCVGEGEEALVALCDALEARQGRAGPPDAPIANLCWRGADGGTVRGAASSFIQDLDALPWWDKALWEGHVRLGDNYLTMTGRGCPYRCTFCFNNFFARLPGEDGGRYVRRRSVENVMGELLAMNERYALRHVDFEDDIFTLDRAWLRRFLPRYRREIGAPFSCLVHPRFIDRELAGMLRDAGCDRIQMGVQSADPEYKRKQLLRMEREAHLERALEALHASGIRMNLDHILGLPGEPPEAQELARELFVRHPPGRVSTYWLTHLPGIDLTRDAHAQGLISDDELAEIHRGRTRLFHHLARGRDHDRVAFYQRYDLLFRALPMLPAALRARARAHHVPELSPALAGLVGAALDGVNTARHRDADLYAYVRHYAMHGARALRERVLGDAPAPTRRPPPPRPERRRRVSLPRYDGAA